MSASIASANEMVITPINIPGASNAIEITLSSADKADQLFKMLQKYSPARPIPKLVYLTAPNKVVFWSEGGHSIVMNIFKDATNSK